MVRRDTPIGSWGLGILLAMSYELKLNLGRYIRENRV